MHLPVAQVGVIYMVTSALETQGSITDAHVSNFFKKEIKPLNNDIELFLFSHICKVLLMHCLVLTCCVYL